jgi:hypothetical protein
MAKKERMYILIQRTFNVLKRRKKHYKICLRRKFLAHNMSPFLQIILAADAHPAERQYVHEEQILNEAKSLIYRAGARKPRISRRKRND